MSEASEIRDRATDWIVSASSPAESDQPEAENIALLADGAEVMGLLLDALDAADEPAEPVAWVDRHGDVWTFPEPGAIGYTHETKPATRSHVELKWGPLVPLVRGPR